MSKSVSQSIQHLNEIYPDLQLVEVETKTRKERMLEAYKKLSDGLDIVIERHKKASSK